jgi:hypothetical protein
MAARAETGDPKGAPMADRHGAVIVTPVPTLLSGSEGTAGAGPAILVQAPAGLRRDLAGDSRLRVG